MASTIRPDGTPVSLVIPDQASGQRLDRAVADLHTGMSRSRVKTLIEGDHVSLDGRTINDPSHRVKGGEAVRLTVPAPEPATPEAQAMALAVVYEDEDVIVIDKPAGLVVHPAAGNRDHTLVNALLAHCGDSLSGIGGIRRPGIVHRLDKDTSGLLVAAKNDAAHIRLAAAFTRRTIERVYTALVWGLVQPPAGEIEGAIGRNPRDRKKMAVVPSGGKPALTRYTLTRAFATTASLVECRLATGRTHQIRVHLAHIGHPLVGDPVYGRGARTSRAPGPAEKTRIARLRRFPRQALHASRLGFDHPRTGHRLSFFSELPNDMIDLVRSLEEV